MHVAMIMPFYVCFMYVLFNFEQNVSCVSPENEACIVSGIAIGGGQLSHAVTCELA
jgi:hypothetical protein